MAKSLLALALTLLTLMAACSREQPLQQARPIRIGYVPYSSSLPALVAYESGILKAKGLNVELVRLETSNEAIVALVKGDIQGLMGIGLPSLLAIEIKTPDIFKMIWYAVETEGHGANALLVPANSTATSIADLRDKTIGTFSGATQLLNLQAILKSALGDVGAAKITQVAPNLQLQALQNGEVAALFTIEPQITIATSRGMGRVLVDNPRCKYIMDPFPAGGAVLATGFIAARSDDAKKLAASFDEAIEHIRADEPAAKAILPKYSPIEADIAAQTRLYGWWTSTEVNMQNLQQMIDLLEHDGVVSGHVDSRNIVMRDKQ